MAFRRATAVALALCLTGSTSFIAPAPARLAPFRSAHTTTDVAEADPRAVVVEEFFGALGAAPVTRERVAAVARALPESTRARIAEEARERAAARQIVVDAVQDGSGAASAAPAEPPSTWIDSILHDARTQRLLLHASPIDVALTAMLTLGGARARARVRVVGAAPACEQATLRVDLAREASGAWAVEAVRDDGDDAEIESARGDAADGGEPSGEPSGEPPSPSKPAALGCGGAGRALVALLAARGATPRVASASGRGAGCPEAERRLAWIRRRARAVLAESVESRRAPRA